MKENKNEKKIDNLPFDEGMDIFGAHKTREEVRAEEKARRKEEREALAQELKRRRQDVKDGKVPTRRKDVLVVCIVLAALVALCMVSLFINFVPDKEDVEKAMNETRGHYVDENAAPALSSDNLTADVSEAYFTNDGHLCVKLLIGNGTDKVRRIEKLVIDAYDYNGQKIAGGTVPFDEDELVLMLMDEIEKEILISPEHVLVDDSYQLANTESFEITITSVPVESE